MDTLKRTTWNFFSGSQLCFGPGAVGVLSGVIGRAEARRVLVISDAVLRDAGVVAQVESALKQTSAEWKVFDGGEAEPSTDTVAKAVEVAGAFGPDLFVAVGGGSNMDLAKTCCAVTHHGSSAESMIGFDNVPGPIPALVCIPTTAGTGSEVSHSAVLRNSSTGKKGAVLSQHIRPKVAIVDPQLTLSCPPKLTAESGIDALTHAIEAYLVTNFYAFREDLQQGLAYEGNHPLGDMYAEKAIQLIGKNLQRACQQGDDLAARSGMALAATLAGAAFSTCGVSLAHALEYPIAAAYHCSHGAGNGIVLPEVMRFWLPTRQSRLAKIAELLSVPDAGELSQEEASEAAIDAVEYFRKSIGLPTRLSDVGGQRADIDDLAETAYSLGQLVALSPREATVDDLQQILEASL